MPRDLDDVRRLVSTEQGLATLATTRRDGSVQISLINAGVLGAEGTVELAGPDDPLPGVDDLARLLRDVFTGAGGTHDDWATYDRVMAEERRTAVLITPTRIYGNA